MDLKEHAVTWLLVMVLEIPVAMAVGFVLGRRRLIARHPRTLRIWQIRWRNEQADCPA
jgi:hypothetical protein